MWPPGTRCSSGMTGCTGEEEEIVASVGRRGGAQSGEHELPEDEHTRQHFPGPLVSQVLVGVVELGLQVTHCNAV